MNNAPAGPSNKDGEPQAERALATRLVRQAKAGDDAAFGELVKLYHTRVYGTVYRLVNNVEDARELEQMTWVKAWKRLDSYKEEAQFFTWIYRIGVNTAMDFLRQRARRREVEMDEARPERGPVALEWPTVSHDTPDRALAHEEIRSTFRKALESLTPEHRAALILREVEGRSYKEIAEVTGLKTGTVMSRIFYARRTIQEKMKGLT